MLREGRSTDISVVRRRLEEKTEFFEGNETSKSKGDKDMGSSAYE